MTSNTSRGLKTKRRIDRGVRRHEQPPLMSLLNGESVMARIKKYKTVEHTLEDAVSEAWSELQSLGEEMREAFDNTPESLQGSSIGQARSDAADNLENLSEPSVPDELTGDKFKVSYPVPDGTPRQMGKRSRPSRRDDATMILEAVSEFLGELQDEDTAKLAGDRKGDEAIEFANSLKEIAESFQQDIDNLKDEAEAVEFPGMYG